MLCGTTRHAYDLARSFAAGSDASNRAGRFRPTRLSANLEVNQLSASIAYSVHVDAPHKQGSRTIERRKKFEKDSDVVVVRDREREVAYSSISANSGPRRANLPIPHPCKGWRLDAAYSEASPLVAPNVLLEIGSLVKAADSRVNAYVSWWAVGGRADGNQEPDSLVTKPFGHARCGPANATIFPCADELEPDLLRQHSAKQNLIHVQPPGDVPAIKPWICPPVMVFPDDDKLRFVCNPVFLDRTRDYSGAMYYNGYKDDLPRPCCE